MYSSLGSKWSKAPPSGNLPYLGHLDGLPSVSLKLIVYAGMFAHNETGRQVYLYATATSKLNDDRGNDQPPSPPHH